MRHLNSDELVDALEGGLEPARQAHLDTCRLCQRELTELSSVLGDVRSVNVPEPSPLYWQRFSERVRAAIDTEPLPSGGWRAWVRWPVLAPIGVLALLVIALTVAVPRQETAPLAIVTNDAPADAALDDSWLLVADMVGDLDWETATAAGLMVTPGAVDRAVLELTAEEQQELTRLLKTELLRAKS